MPSRSFDSNGPVVAVALTLGVALPGCGPGILGASDAGDSSWTGETGWDDATTDDGPDDATDTGEDDSGVLPVPDVGSGDECPEIYLESGDLPVYFEGVKPQGSGMFQGACGGGSAAERGHVFRAPQAGDYRITTAGSSFDTVLWVKDGQTCDGPQLACNDDFGGTLESQVIVSLDDGQEVVVGVDGFSEFDGGPYELRIDLVGAASCPEGALPSAAPQQTTVPAADFLPIPPAWCGFEEQLPASARTFRAPETGEYTFFAFAETGPASVRALFGETCDPELEFDCAFPDEPLFLFMEAGQTVTLVADAWPSSDNSVTWYVESSDLPPPPPPDPDCPGIDLGDEFPIQLAGDLAIFEPASGGCSGLPANANAFYWTTPFPDSFRISAEGTPWDHILTVRYGHGCSGSTAACIYGTPDDPAQHFINFPNSSGNQITVFIEPAQPMPAGEYQLTID